MDPLWIGWKYRPSSLLCLHRLPHGVEKILEDPISKCHLRKLGPFFIGSQLAMVTIVLYPVTMQGKNNVLK